MIASSSDPYLEFLLDIKSEKHFRDENGRNFFDELAAMQERDDVYLAIRKKVNQRNAKDEDIRYFLFMGYVAYTRNAAASMEAMTTDLMPVYRSNTKNVLLAMKASPFLIEASCYYLGNYFGFEGKNKKGKSEFMQEITTHLKAHLSPEKVGLCLSSIGT